MVICKFKVGDMVVAKSHNGYAFTTDGWTGRVTKVFPGGDFEAMGEGNPIYNQRFGCLDPQQFDLVTTPNVEEKIVITHDGKTTTATKYCADGSKVTATARCAPEDDFNFQIGAEIAMGRLVDKLVFA